MKEIANADETSLDQTPFLEESRLKEIANDAIERYKERSVNLGTTAVTEKPSKVGVCISCLNLSYF